jgi:MtrB/PioB family decaheme-associated outer membrane protein
MDQTAQLAVTSNAKKIGIKMKTSKKLLVISQLTLAVQAALLAMLAVPNLAFAVDDEISALIRPTNTIEIGAVNTSADSAKYGEYNGLNKSGANLLGNFNIRGGDAYDGEGGVYRWQLKGADLGTTSRDLSGSASSQGKWSFGLGYDELRHNYSDTYQTPYVGSMGGNKFTLPGFGTAADTNALSPTQKAAFQKVDVGTTRKNTSFNAGYNIDSRWDVRFDFNRLDQSGAKLMSFGAAAIGGAGGEVISILPNPTNYQTDTINMAVNWKGDKGHMTASYFGSYFKEGYDRVSFTTFNTANADQLMSTMPSNDFHQLNLTGGYAYSSKTKLTGGVSIGRNTQNDPFVVDSAMYVSGNTAPGNLKTSLDGLVLNTHADLKLSDQTTKDLALSAGVKYDERDNQTQSNIYNFNAISGSANNIAFYPNTPLSTKKSQLELAGDYRLDKDQRIRLAYTREDVKRWCNQYAVGTVNAVTGLPYALASAGGVNNYPAGTNCVVATASADDKLSAAYKFKANENVNLNASYSYSNRKTDSDQNAVASFIGMNGNVTPVQPSPSVNATLIRGVNGGDFIGFSPFFDASRTEQLIKAGVNWQANEKLSLGLGGKYTDDKYGSTYGVQNGSSWSLNLDSTYAYSESGSVFAYVTQQHRQRDLTDQQNSLAGAASSTKISVPANSSWSNTLKDDDTTVGLGAKQGGLMAGKLELLGDLTYTTSTTGYATQLNYAGLTTGSLGCGASILLTCGQVPDFKSESVKLKVTGIYQVDKKSKIALGYVFQKLNSTDYYYNGMAYGNTPTKLMPTYQEAANYIVNAVFATYLYSF